MPILVLVSLIGQLCPKHVIICPTKWQSLDLLEMLIQDHPAHWKPKFRCVHWYQLCLLISQGCVSVLTSQCMATLIHLVQKGLLESG